MKTVHRQLVWANIISDGSIVHTCDQQTAQQLRQPSLGARDMFIPMEQRLDLGGVSLMLNQRVCLKDPLQSVRAARGPVA